MRSSWLASATNWRTRVSLACRAGQGAADVAEHPVEGEADLPDLGARVGVAVGHALGRLDLAAVERQRADPAGGGGDPVAAAAATAGRSTAPATAATTRPQPDDHAPRATSRATRVVDAGQRQAGDDDVAVGAVLRATSR